MQQGPPSDWEPPPAPWVPPPEPPARFGGMSRVAIGIAAGCVILGLLALSKAKPSAETPAAPPAAVLTRNAVVLADDLLAGRAATYVGRRVKITGLASKVSGRAVMFDGRPRLNVPATMRASETMPRTPTIASLDCRASTAQRSGSITFDDCFASP